MKLLVNISRFFVGALFIFSGLIKLNDPLGLSYKLEEYFSSVVLNLPFLGPFALGIAIFLVIFEVTLGLFLWIGYKPKFTVWSLLGLIMFFTFLTFYAAYFDKVRDCGCFGDFLKLTPWQSFTKDVILLVLILVLFFGLRHIKPLFNKLGVTIVALLGFIASLWLGYHVLMHLPIIDFRAYKIGNNILDEMSVPENAKKPVIEYTWVFNVNGEEKQYVSFGSYPEVDGKYVSVETKVIEEGYEPKILDFSIESSEEDLTNYFLEKENLIMVVAYNLATAEKDGLAKLKSITDQAIKNGYTVIGLTASGDKDKQIVMDTYNLNFDFYLCDEKVLKTIVRSNPGVLKLKKGTVIQKVHWNDIDDLALEILPNALPNLDFELKKELDEIYKLDQGVRQIYFAQTSEEKKALAEKLNLPVQDNEAGYMRLWDDVDSLNLVRVESIFKVHGYPGKALVGEPTNKSAWFVIQHSPKIPEYLPMMKEAASKGDLDKDLVAMMEDRYLMGRGKAQIYGSQGITLNDNSDDAINIIWPIENPDQVNARRTQAGFKETVELYGNSLFGEDFEFRNYTLKEVKQIEKNNPWIMDLLKNIN